jgi:peptide/nickel transport system permease protein
MSRYLARRMLAAAGTVWAVLTLIFIVVRVVPGDPAAILLGTFATPALLAEQRARLGLDRPLAEQYVHFLRQAASGDWGLSYFWGTSPLRLVSQAFPATLELAVASLALTLVSSLVLGSLAAVWVGSAADRAIGTFSLVGQAMPSFWLGIVAILLFAKDLRWLPSYGSGGVAHLVLPAVTLSVQYIGLTTRLVRAGVLETQSRDFVRTARAKGASAARVIVHHIYRNMLIPVVTMTGLQMGNLIGGVVVTETVFSWPGLGRLIIDAIGNRDYPVVQAAVTFTAVLFVLLNLGVDMTYGVLDPRIRYE